MRLAALQPSVQSTHAALVLHSRSSRIHTTTGGLGDRNVSADRRVPGDRIAGELSTDLRGLYHRGDETGGSCRVAGLYYAVLAAVEADVMETIVPSSILRR